MDLIFIFHFYFIFIFTFVEILYPTIFPSIQRIEQLFGRYHIIRLQYLLLVELLFIHYHNHGTLITQISILLSPVPQPMNNYMTLHIVSRHIFMIPLFTMRNICTVHSFPRELCILNFYQKPSSVIHYRSFYVIIQQFPIFFKKLI